ncbi:MAG TPA: hypothetical protein VHU61_02350, partial [Solirubrobacteraceae bacterium]|nr:hypothetical protein [Solirubrobacteraceae bacterium]
AEIRSYRIDVLSGALGRRRQEGAQPHGVHARRAAQGLLLSIDRSETESDTGIASDPPDEPA